MYDVEPIELSRTLNRAEDAAREWQERLPELAVPEDAPLLEFRRVLSQQYYDEVSETLPASDPLRPALMRWLSLLIERRVNGAVTTELARLRYHERHDLEAPERGEFTLAALSRKVLQDEPRKAWLAGLAQCSRPASELVVRSWQRRAEVHARLRGPSLDEVELPGGETYAIAHEVLDWTQPLTAETPSLVVSLGQLFQPTPLAFPTHLNARTLADWFRETRLLEAVNPRPFSWPAPVAAASFALALGRFGAAWHRALAPRNQPFVVAVDPLGLEEQSTGWLFAQLPSHPAFQRRHLDGSKAKQRDVNRYWAKVGLHDLRLRAARVLTRQALLLDLRERPKALEQLGERLWAEPSSLHLTGVLPQLRANDAQGLYAVGLAALRHDALVEAHNDDWYRNPRAIDELRSTAGRPPEWGAPADEVRRGIGLYVRQLTHWLS